MIETLYLRWTRLVLLAPLLASLVACSPMVKTELLQPVRSPVTEVDVMVLMGTFQQPANLPGIQPIDVPRRDALNRLIPALLSKNGVAVHEYKQPHEWTYRNELVRATEQGPADRYLLLIESDKYVVEQNIYRSVLFEVRLFDRKIRRPVWKATVRYSIVDKKVNAQAEVFIRDLLLGLARDNLIKMPAPEPIDLKGQVIKLSPVWEDDR
jgi:hypothetical protein